MANKVNDHNRLPNSTKYQKKIKEKLNYQFIPLEESLVFHLENYKKTKILRRS